MRGHLGAPQGYIQGPPNTGNSEKYTLVDNQFQKYRIYFDICIGNYPLLIILFSEEATFALLVPLADKIFVGTLEPLYI